MQKSVEPRPLLLYEPQRTVRLTLEAQLREQGYQLRIADNPEQAYDAFLDGAYDSVLAHFDGKDSTHGAHGTLLERLHDLAPEVPIIALSSHEDPSLQRLALQHGAFGYLKLPAITEELRSVLTQARIYRRLEAERRHALAEVCTTKKFYEDVLVSVNEGIIVFDERGCIRFQNQEATRILSGDEVLEEPEEDPDERSSNVTKSLIAQIMQLLASTLAEGREERRMLVVEADPRRVHLEVITSRLRASDGATKGAIALLRDRSTEMLLEEQLVHTERLASLGGLLASIAHEIHNPLTCVTGCAELGLEAAQEAELAASSSDVEHTREALTRAASDMRELFDQVQEAGLRCQGIANNLLAYSRRAPAQLKRVDVNELLERTLTFITRYRKLGGLEVTSDLQTNLPKASVDGAELQQAFTNIIENALHAMDGREPAELELKSRLEDQRIHIEIGDSGPGIRPRRLERIWEPFFTTKANGTGLGLYITKRIIERQRGRVSVTSTPDAGTRFLISLPLS